MVAITICPQYALRISFQTKKRLAVLTLPFYQALATLVFLDGRPDQLQAIYESESAGLKTWIPSPRSIYDEENKIRLLSDTR